MELQVKLTEDSNIGKAIERVEAARRELLKAVSVLQDACCDARVEIEEAVSGN